MAFGFPASYETEIEVTGSHMEIRDAIENSFELLGWEFSSDDTRSFFTARVPPSLTSWREFFTVSLAKQPLITLGSKCWQFQLFDWGKNKRNVELFLEIFPARLSRVSALSDQAPVYLDADGRTPIERLIAEPSTHPERKISEK